MWAVAVWTMPVRVVRVVGVMRVMGVVAVWPVWVVRMVTVGPMWVVRVVMMGWRGPMVVRVVEMRPVRMVRRANRVQHG